LELIKRRKGKKRDLFNLTFYCTPTQVFLLSDNAEYSKHEIISLSMAQEVQNTTTVSVKIVTKEKTRILLSNYHFENRFISKVSK